MKHIQHYFAILTLSILSSSILTAESAKRLDDLVVTASRNLRSLNTVSSNVTLITAEDIEKTGAVTVPEILKQAVGINVQDHLGTGRTVSVDIRGYGESAASNTLVLIDGRRINRPTLAGIDWTVVPIERIKQIEIIRGGMSALYGDGAVGGTINIITKKGAPANKLYFDSRVESYEGYRESLSLSGEEGNWFYSADFTYRDTDGYRDNGYFTNKFGGLTLNYDGDDFFSADFSGAIKQDSYGMPGAVAENNLDKREDAANPDDWGETYTEYLQFTPALKLEVPGKISVVFDYRRVVQESFFAGWGGFDYNIIEYGIKPKYDLDYSLGGFNSHLTTGVDYINSELHYVEGFFAGQIRKKESREYYVYNTTELIADSLFLDAGYRRSRVDFDFDTIESEVFDIDSSRLGLTYRYDESSKLFISYDRSFRTIKMDELGGPSFDQILEPQLSKQFQAGISHHFNKFLDLTLSVFDITTYDEIFLDPNAGWGQNQNYEETRRQGVEISFESNPTEKISLYLNYAYTNAELKDGNYDGNRVPGVPRHVGSAGVHYEPAEGLDLNLQSRFSNDKIILSDWANTSTHWGDSYAVVDFNISYDYKIFTFYAGVNNLFNEEYSEYGVLNFLGNNTYYPSPERNIYAGIKISKEF
ncbi:MAG: TonB-dependent receptor [Verrucomicrobiota bacterium]|nr:TonB-dependent receptor [Verrucomicrobiota bacterium]